MSDLLFEMSCKINTGDTIRYLYYFGPNFITGRGTQTERGRASRADIQTELESRRETKTDVKTDTINFSSGRGLVFLPESPNDKRDRLRLFLKEEDCGTDTEGFDVEIIAIVDTLLENNCISPNQHMFSTFN